MVLVGMVRCDLTREQRSRSAYIPIFVRKLPDLYILISLSCLSRFADFGGTGGARTRGTRIKSAVLFLLSYGSVSAERCLTLSAFI